MSVIVDDYEYEVVVVSGVYYAQCHVVDKTKQSYGSILTSVVIDGVTRTVAYLRETFKNCTNLTEPPTIPSSTVSMDACFYGCTSLTTAPEIPHGVRSMNQCFHGCTALMTAPEIPSSLADMNSSFYGCTSLTTVPNIPSGVTGMNNCFYGCTSLTTVPNIPSGVTGMNNCFYGCTSLTTVVVYNSSITSAIGVFKNTTNNIYIINGAETSAVETMWKSIASGYSNVHYEADDNPVPSLSFTATRVGGMASETPSENGQYAFINATAIVYETYLPDGWSCAYDAGEEDITKDGTTASPYWTRTHTDNVWTLKCWFSLGDTTKHTFTLRVADEITDENDNVKASQLSAIITQIIPKAYKLVDYYHDPNTDTEGMSVGKFATEANLFDVDMPALFRDTLSLTDGNAVARLLFDYVYPVGSYYETSKSQAEFDPNVVWGGTWVLETAGQVHVSSGTGYVVNGALTNASDGGSEYIQEHRHGFTNPTINNTSGTHNHTITVRYRTKALASGTAQSQPYANASNTSTAIAYTSTTGGHGHSYSANGSVNAVSGVTAGQGGNMMPYIIVNRWHRTA